MSKITLSNIGNTQNITSASGVINSNNDLLEDAITNTLSRDGTGPNNMSASLDMNSNKIINLPKGTSPTEPVRKAEFDAAILGSLGVVTPGILSTDGDTLFARPLTGVTGETVISTPNGDTGSANVGLDTTLNFTGKTINNGTYNSPTMVTPTIGNATATTVNKVTLTQPTTGATLTIPDGVVLTGPAASGTTMTLGNAETVTGVKSFNSGIVVLKGSTSGSTTLNASSTASGTLTLPAASDTLVGKSTTDTLINKTFETNNNTFSINGSGVTSNTGTGSTIVRSVSPTLTTPSFSSIVNTGTLTLPTSTDTLVGKATIDTLTNKTFDTAATGNSLSINGLAATTNTGTGSVVRATSPTITSATLTTPVISSIVNTGTLTVPTATDILVARTTTDTLTNKTLTSPAINTPVVSGGSIDNATVGSTTPSSGKFTSLEATQTLKLTGVITPTILASSQNDWAPTGFSTSTVIRASSSAGINITGLAGGVEGLIITIHNIGSNDIVLKNENASSTAANRFTIAADITISAGLSTTLRYDGTSSRWRAISGTGSGAGGGSGTVTSVTAGSGLSGGTIVSSGTLSADPQIFQNYLSGLTLSTAGSSTTFSMAVGIANDSANTVFMSLTSAISKTTGAWTVGTGNGALDTGSIAANTWYHVFLIQRPDTGVVDVAISTSATSITTGGNIPAAYTKFRRVGSMKTNGSSQWIKFSQSGDEFLWDSAVADVAVTNPGTTAALRTISTPLGVSVSAIISIQGQGIVDGRGWASSPNVSDQSASSFQNYGSEVVAAGGAVVSASLSHIRTNTSSQIRTRNTASDGNTIITVYTIGWIDNRGVGSNGGAGAVSSVTAGEGLIGGTITTTGTIKADPLVHRSYLAGLTLSTAGSSATYGVAAGVAVDSTNVGFLSLASAFTKTTSSWVVGTANGSLDTGSIANNTWYHVYVIKRTDTNLVDVLISLSATSPTLPTNYTLFRRIGALLTNGSAQWTKFSQFGDEFLWDTLVSDFLNSTFSTTATLVTVRAPIGVKSLAMVYVEYSCSSTILGYVSSPDQADVAVSTSNFNITGGVGCQFPGFNGNIRTNTSSQIRVRTDTSTGATGNVVTRGWIDRRGRDD